ncbi:hypothetical protein [Pectinatus brassicae]|uniref:Phage shock protein A n=1 Tax=Pectinatus brassicae TaxID=862415 RepID=A0A840UHT7_9FIRM|nr:hypothetical protein [Pectinatus brassicae]MBB5337301.1 phage shock protein A [Pectinatus brassicae]
MSISGISAAISSYSQTSTSTSSSVTSVATLEAQKNRYEQALLSLQGASATDSNSNSTTSSSTQIASIERSITKITQEIAQLKNKAAAEALSANQTNISKKPEKEKKESLQEKFGSAYSTSISAEGYDTFIQSQQLNKANNPANNLS